MSDRRTSPPRPPRARRFLLLVLILLAVILVARVALNQTDIVPETVDFVRNLPFVGPERMAAIEDAYYEAQDGWNTFIYDRTHAPVVVAEVVGEKIKPPATDANALDPAQAGNSPTPVPTLAPAELTQEAIREKTITPTPTPTPGPIFPAHPKSIPPLILSDPQQGEGVWSSAGLPYGNNSRPPLLHTFYRPDPERPFARVDLVWMDMSQAQLNMVPGTSEPRSTGNVQRGEAKIPDAVQQGTNLLASWNGGFLTMHGAYGMMVNRTVIAPPRNGFAALGQYADGTMHIGVWGRDMKMTSDLIAFRQNGPILIDHGVLNEADLVAWGASVSGETRIWRSGVGITRDGALLYAAGPSLSAQTLGLALQRAGAYEAMQLDVNAWHVFFFTYQYQDGLVPSKLSAALPGSTRMYLTPYDRDFMYLTLRQGPQGLPARQQTPLPTFTPTLPGVITSTETPVWRPTIQLPTAKPPVRPATATITTVPTTDPAAPQTFTPAPTLDPGVPPPTGEPAPTVDASP